MKSVVVVKITHPHGVDLLAGADEVAAERALLGYVKEWWDREDETSGSEMPNDPQEAINAYFDAVEDENYEYVTVEVEQ